MPGAKKRHTAKEPVEEETTIDDPLNKEAEEIWTYCPSVDLSNIPAVVTDETKAKMEVVMKELENAIQFIDMVAIDRHKNLQRSLSVLLLIECKRRMWEYEEKRQAAKEFELARKNRRMRKHRQP